LSELLMNEEKVNLLLSATNEDAVRQVLS